MPKAKFFKGYPVKRMYRADGGIKLILVSPVAGKPGRKLIISQEDWDTYGTQREVEKNTASALRALAKKRGNAPRVAQA